MGGDTIETHDGIESIAGEWDRLALRVGSPPFLRPGWFSAWWGAFGSGRLTVLALRRGGELAGVLPVRHRRGAVLSPTNWHTPEYGPVAVDDAAGMCLFEEVFAGGPRCVDFSFLDGDVAERLGSAAGARKVASRVIARSPYVAVDRDWDSYWSGLSKNLRGTVRRCHNRLAERGEVTVEVFTGGDGLGERFEEGLRLEASGWKGEKGTAIASRPETRRFYEEVCRRAEEGGTLCLSFLRIDGVAVAFNLGLETEKSHYLLKPGHDAALDSAGPGTVLTAEMVKRAFERGLKTYEFLGDADRYKLRWASACHEMARAQAFAPTLSGRLDRLVQTNGRALAKKILRRGP